MTVCKTIGLIRSNLCQTTKMATLVNKGPPSAPAPFSMMQRPWDEPLRSSESSRYICVP